MTHAVTSSDLHPVIDSTVPQMIEIRYEITFRRLINKGLAFMNFHEPVPSYAQMLQARRLDLSS